MEKNIIAAISDNSAIGRQGDMPWHISEDLKYFKRITSGGTVIMGRKTFLSIGRPLPSRVNIVITRGNGSAFPEGVLAAHSLQEAYTIAGQYGKPCFVIGGGEIYRQAMQDADTLYITHVHTTVNDADTFFPEIDPRIWVKTESSEKMKDAETGCCFEFSVYKRKM